MTVPNSLFENPVFKDALAEIEGMGFRVSERSVPGATPYGVIGGRSNQRWWLVPLNDRRLTARGLALFQPISASAKVLKSAAEIAIKLGLSSIWLREKIYITECSSLEAIFSEEDLRYAFFTGTDSPHRKVAVQIMSRDGLIKGFAKVTKSGAVKPLLQHEAEMLDHLNTLDLKTALIPKVLFSGEVGYSEVLVTDSLKTARSKTVTALNEAHIFFLQELKEKAEIPALAGDVSYVAVLRNQYDIVAESLTDEWRQRLSKVLGIIEVSGVDLGAQGVTHGDFTPWNTFLVNGKLYVFDWEYASDVYLMGYDLIHYTLSLPAVKRLSCMDTIRRVRTVLHESKVADDEKCMDILFLSYLLKHSLYYAARQMIRDEKVNTWDGEPDAAAYLDALIERKS